MIVNVAIIAPIILSIVFGNVLVLISLVRFSPVTKGMTIMIGMFSDVRGFDVYLNGI